MEVSSGPNKWLTLMSTKNQPTFPKKYMRPFIEVDPNLETAEITSGETICRVRMNRIDDGIELEDNDEEEKLEEKPPSAKDNLQAIRTSKKISQIPYWLFRWALFI
ncbi:hypothetical protein AVEN_220232-1 [Araneus ventricosus]|uniref:Uncharacterized protein n=1 Tax=Araneus ventricosus TaxID=182803 RepID=A0A4Y2ERN5_ARAVE|nr:hypothetical protein AVEN_220232-1 [Araneus ventricosus]